MKNRTCTDKALARGCVRARWRGWKGIIWLVSGLGYSGLRSTSSFNVGTEGATTVSGSNAASLARDTSCKHRTDQSVSKRRRRNRGVGWGGGRRDTHLVSEGFEFTGGAGVQVHELVSVDEQGRFLALVLVFEGTESSALHLQDTGQVSDVALKSQESSPDLPARSNKDQRSTPQSTTPLKSSDQYETVPGLFRRQVS